MIYLILSMLNLFTHPTSHSLSLSSFIKRFEQYQFRAPFNVNLSHYDCQYIPTHFENRRLLNADFFQTYEMKFLFCWMIDKFLSQQVVVNKPEYVSTKLWFFHDQLLQNHTQIYFPTTLNMALKTPWGNIMSPISLSLFHFNWNAWSIIKLCAL